MLLFIQETAILLVKFIIALIMLVTIFSLIFANFYALISTLNKYTPLKKLNVGLPQIVEWLSEKIVKKSTMLVILEATLKIIVLLEKITAIGIVIIMMVRGIPGWTFLGILIGCLIAAETGIIVGGGIGVLIGIVMVKRAWNTAAETISQKTLIKSETSTK